MFGEEKKALRILKITEEIPSVPEPKKLSEQEKIEQKQKLDQAKSQLLAKLTQSNA
ncbi:MAG: hypothetical protein Q4B28_08695 [bacterium]|nr:hypothetical protein [bacterium]